MTGSDCNQERIESYLLGASDEAESAAVESHLNACRECQLIIEQLAADGDFWNAASSLLISPGPYKIPSASGSNGVTLPTDPTFDGIGGEFATLRYLANWLCPSDNQDALGKLAKYEIRSVCGCGGMGLVLKGYDTDLKRHVAIKTLRQHLTGSQAARRRFYREAQLAASLRHTNIVEIYSVDVWDGVPYFVMPYHELGSLADYTDSKRLQLADVLSIATQVADGIAAAHASGMIHRDIKPSNILLADGIQKVVLSDFGLARGIDDSLLTLTDSLAGTPQYMSPEQAQGKPIDARSDLFSLGSVIYWMIAGKSPFAADTGFGTISRILNETHVPLKQQLPNTPAWLDHLLDRLLEKQPQNRTLPAEEVATLLRQCSRHLDAPKNHPLPRLSKKQLRFHQTTLAWLAVSTLLFAPAGIIWLTQFRKQEAATLNDSQVANTVADTTTIPSGEETFDPSIGSNRSSRTDGPVYPFGPLSGDELRELQDDFAARENLAKWLERLENLPLDQIPNGAMPTIERLAGESEDDEIKRVANKILSLNPFEEVLENPFQEIPEH